MEENRRGDEGADAAQRAELQRLASGVLGSFTAADGEHRCLIAYAGEEALVYDVPPRGPARCLAWVGGHLGDAEAESRAVFRSYAERAGSEGRALCRAVSGEEIARLRSAVRRAA